MINAKTQQAIETHFGQTISHLGQKFVIGHASTLGGVYVTASEDGRIPQGDAMWLSDEAFLSKIKELDQGCRFSNKVEARAFKIGVIYSGAGGEAQLDREDGKTVWHRSDYDGRIQRINPDPSSLWVVKQEVSK